MPFVKEHGGGERGAQGEEDAPAPDLVQEVLIYVGGKG